MFHIRIMHPLVAVPFVFLCSIFIYIGAMEEDEIGRSEWGQPVMHTYMQKFDLNLSLVTIPKQTISDSIAITTPEKNGDSLFQEEFKKPNPPKKRWGIPRPIEPPMLPECKLWFTYFCGNAQILMENIERKVFLFSPYSREYDNELQQHVGNYFAARLSTWSWWSYNTIKRYHKNQMNQKNDVFIIPLPTFGMVTIRNPTLSIDGKQIFPHLTQQRWKEMGFLFMLICAYKLHAPGTTCRAHSIQTSAEYRLEDYFENSCLCADRELNALRAAGKNLMPLCPLCAIQASHIQTHPNELDEK
ncbi:MAG: hypothetical protein WCE21_04845 [Candidatus Babeliales bacterium]